MPQQYTVEIEGQIFSRMAQLVNGRSVPWTHVIVVKHTGDTKWIDFGWATSMEKAKKRVSPAKKGDKTAEVKIIETAGGL